MDYLNAILLGLVQGLTEFLPVSSSAHLRIVGEFLPGARDPGAAFTAIIQLGTEVAVVIYFRRDIARIVSRWAQSLVSRGGRRSSGVQRGDPDARLGWLVIIATVPIVVVGVLAQHLIETSLRNLWITAVVLIVFGVLLGVVDRIGSRERRITDVTYRDGVLIGVAQVLSLIPGVSRSGATTTAARALGYERPAAARFSFFLAIPAVFGSGLYELYGALHDSAGSTPYGWGETAVAGVVAFAVGLAVIAFLMRYLERGSFLPFVVYRILLGAVLIVLLVTGVLSPLGGPATGS